MTSPTVDENPEPGESGYYDWHKAVAKHHNDKAGVGAHHAASRVSVTTSGLAVVSSTDVQAALADLDGRGIDTVDTSPLGGSDGDLVGVDGAGSAKLIDSGTFRTLKDADETITVGTGGDHSNLREALKAASRLYPVFAHGGRLLEVRLLTGFELDQQIDIVGIDLGWLRLSSDDAEVTIQRDQLNDGPAIQGRESATLPLMSVLFNTDTTGSAGNTVGCKLTERSRATFLSGAGFKGAANRNLNAAHGSTISADGSDFSGAASYGARISNASTAYLRGATIENCTEGGIRGGGASIIHAVNAALKGNGAGISTSDVCVISAVGADVSNCSTGVQARRNDHIQFRDGVADGCDTAVLAQDWAVVDAQGATLTNATDWGIDASGMAYVFAAAGSASGAADLTGSSVRRADESVVITGSETKTPYRSKFPLDLGNPHGWGAINGSPTFGEYTSPVADDLDRQSVQLLADGTNERVAMPLFIPPNAPSWKLRVYWVYAGTTTGDVRIACHMPDNAAQAQGDSFGNETKTVVADVTTTNPGQHVLQVIEGSSQTATGFLSVAMATWSTSSLSAGEVIHVIAAEIVEA